MKWNNPGRPTFPAGFDSEIDCGCEVQEGEPIGYDRDDQLCCAEHINDADGG